MQDKIDRLLQDVAAIKEGVATVKEEVAHLNQSIFRGNGKPSLLARVEVVEGGVAELKWYKRMAVGGVVTGFIGLAFAALERFAG